MLVDANLHNQLSIFDRDLHIFRERCYTAPQFDTLLQALDLFECYSVKLTLFVQTALKIINHEGVACTVKCIDLM